MSLEQIQPREDESWQTWVRRWILWNRLQARPLQGLQLPVFSLSNLPRSGKSGMMIFVNDETGGPTPAYSVLTATGGSNWHRVADGAVVS